ncbi:winged helix-turn-helix domain-containing protein [Buttiauxella noackiae]|uniref:winged helix-turn-helix domain-containing protein n=1 Tax=Buttiauxella noackiae TaxID=82992 RepID=UPI003B5CD748
MSKPRYSVNNWLLDFTSGAIVHRQSGEIRRLGEYQLKLLDCLIEHAGQTLSRNELTGLVWERRVIGDNSLSNAIHALRAALEDDGKQQRVIKTIPKKGYLLDPEFCQLIEPEADIVSSPAPVSNPTKVPEGKYLIQPEMAETVTTNTVSVNDEITVPLAAKRIRYSLPPWSVLSLLLLICVITLSAWLIFFHKNCDEMVAQEQQKNQYSNIRVFRIAAAVDEMNDEDIVKLKPTLKALNQELIAHDAWMTVYYRTDEQVLNYTFSIETTCANQQLAMTLYHWRIDNLKLTNTIFGETERKLNEMAVCTKS